MDMLPEGQSDGAKFAGGVASFVPAAVLGGGGLIGNSVKYGIAPGLASEGLGKITEGTAAEPYARLAGALMGPAAYQTAGRAANAIGGGAVHAAISPNSVVGSKLATALQQARTTPEALAEALSSARTDGQSMFTVADAMGNTGQRMLSGIVRQPGDARSGIIDALEQRQAGQGRRLTNVMQEGFAAPDTAAQRVAALEAERGAAADLAYVQARQNAGPIDMSFLNNFTTAGIPDANQIAKGINAAKQQFMIDGAPAANFDAAFMGKKALGDMMDTATRGGQNELARALSPIKSSADDALAAASPTYANARDQYKAASGVIDSVGLGAAAKKGGRVEDTIPAFKTMPPEQQAAFRVGYADPYIADIQGAVGHGTNRARPLLSDATAQEFPAFAAPGEADRLMNRIGRENTMFETRQAALGGSKTADNLADMHNVSDIPTGVISNLLSGHFAGAAKSLFDKAAVAGGNTENVRNKLAEALMQSDPEYVKSILGAAVKKNPARDTRVEALMKGGAQGALNYNERPQQRR
jgi:hypothetical protein